MDRFDHIKFKNFSPLRTLWVKLITNDRLGKCLYIFMEEERLITLIYKNIRINRKIQCLRKNWTIDASRNNF